MSVNYDLYETPNPDKEGEVLPLHARVLLKGSYTAEEFADQVVAFQHMPGHGREAISPAAFQARFALCAAGKARKRLFA